MLTPQSPLTSLLAWLTVSVLVLTGAPVSARSGSLQNRHHRAMATEELANTIASLDLSQAQGSAPLPILKVWDLMTATHSALFTTPSFQFPRQLKPCSVAPASARRLCLVGMIELRI